MTDMKILHDTYKKGSLLFALSGSDPGEYHRRLQEHVTKTESRVEMLYFVALEAVMAYQEPRPSLEYQARVGRYRVDVLIADKLVIELDGHDFHEKTKEQAKRDKGRDRTLLAQGYTTIRFTGSEVWADPFSCACETLDLLESV